MNIKEVLAGINAQVSIEKQNLEAEITRKLVGIAIGNLDSLIETLGIGDENRNNLLKIRTTCLETNNPELYFNSGSGWVDYRKRTTLLSILSNKIAKQMLVYSYDYILPCKHFSEVLYNILVRAQAPRRGFQEQRVSWLWEHLQKDILETSKQIGTNVKFQTCLDLAFDWGDGLEEPRRMKVHRGFKIKPELTGRAFSEKIMELFEESIIESETP